MSKGCGEGATSVQKPQGRPRAVVSCPGVLGKGGRNSRSGPFSPFLFHLQLLGAITQNCLLRWTGLDRGGGHSALEADGGGVCACEWSTLCIHT